MLTLDIAPLRSELPPQKHSGRPMARVLKGFYSLTCTLTRSSAIGMSRCLPGRIACTNLPTPEEWKAE